MRDKKHFMRVRYKPTNEVELHEWVEHDTHFEEKKVGIVFQSTNLSFIPVDIQQGPDGAMYVADWYNPVKGHAQYSLRDTRRDKKSGRIWRITAKDQPLEEAPKIAGASIPELLELLKSENYRTRYRAKVELRERDAKEVQQDLKAWCGWKPQSERVAKFAPNQSESSLVEALWKMVSLVHPTGIPLVTDDRSVWQKTPQPIRDTHQFFVVMWQSLLNSKDAHIRAVATRALRFVPLLDIVPHVHYSLASQANKRLVVRDETPLRFMRTVEVLRKSANDPSGLVRLEAAIAASYIGTPEALEAALDLLKHPMDSYLTYALRTSLDSHTLQPLWKGKTAFMEKHPELVKFLQDSEPKKPAQMAKKKKTEKPDPFDAQPGVQTVTIKTIPERLLFDLREFKVAPGAPVKLVFENPDVTPHNLLIVQPGAADEVGMAGNEMAKTPDGMAKGFIPDSPKIMHKTKMLMQGDGETLRFQAPQQPGRYPYICTFPGHWLVMKGEMIVE
jgi:plastocyanin